MITLMGSDKTEDEFVMARRHMLRYDIEGRGVSDRRVLDVMGRLRREQFVPEGYKLQAYSDGPLPIGQGQTISQPYIVALMTEQLCLDERHDVLEIGTGSGYQTAILAGLARKVYTVEKIAELSESAKAVLGRLGVENVRFHVGDGSCGWPEDRVFDRIMVTAAVPRIPEPLVEQLAVGGLMVAPVGSRWVQELIVGRKTSDGMEQRGVCDVQFVKLYGRYGFNQ